jgi:hypothetical protein
MLWGFWTKQVSGLTSRLQSKKALEGGGRTERENTKKE